MTPAPYPSFPSSTPSVAIRLSLATPTNPDGSPSEPFAAAHRHARVLDGDLVTGFPVCCCETFVETNHERSLSLDTTVAHRIREEMYFTKGVPTMGDHTHPMEGAILDFSITRMRLIDLFNRDGEICDEEQAALELFDDAKRTVKHLHHIDQAAETYKKQYHQGITPYGQRKWHLAGLVVEPYEPNDAA